MSKLIFGCGYLGSRVARRWLDVGQQVHVVTRSEARAAEFGAAGYQPIVADILQPNMLSGLPVADTVLYAVGFDRAGGASRDEVYVGGLKSALAALPAETGKFIYISSTGVYGQTDGEWVDEDSPTEPTRGGGLACLAAERALAAHPLGQRALVLRLAGLYGPERIPNAAELRAGRPLAAPADGFLNLIHVDDGASVVLAAERLATPPRTYVVSDGNPTERRAYYQELARLLAAPPPRFAPAEQDSPAAARATSDKRARNVRMLTELLVDLEYPSYREGLAAILAVENAHRA